MMRFRRWAAALLAGIGGIAPAQDAPDQAIVVTATKPGTGWQEATTRHFVVYGYDTARHVGQYAARLETFDKAIRVLHGTPEDRRGEASRVTVYVLDSIGAVQRLAHNPRIAGYYQPRTHAQAFMPRDTGEARDYGMSAQSIMFHEYTHHWMLTTWTDAAFPAWYSEGAAELHATAIVRPDGSVTFGAVPTYRANSLSATNLPAPRLLRGRIDKLDDREIGTLYGRGWLLAHYLTFDADRRKALAQYIAAINGGKTPDEAAATLGNVDALDGRLNAYGQHAQLPSITLPASDLPIGSVTVRSLGAGEAAVMPALMRSRSGVDKDIAPAVVTQARQVAGQYPTDPAVLNELAEAEYDVASLGPEADRGAGYARVEAAADRALALDPKSVHALLYKGMAKQAQAVSAKATDPATWGEVRRWYIAANRAATEDPEPLIAFYESFGAAKQAPSKSAEAGLLYAYALAPHATDARLDATRVLLGQGRVAEARAALAPIAYRADLAGGKAILDILTAIDTGGAQAGLAAMKANEDKAKADAEKKKRE